MSKEPRVLARRGAQAMTAAAMVAGGTLFAVSPAHAALPLPTITSVVVAGTKDTKVVTAGTTVAINGTGFTGMVDNAADAACSTSAAATAAWPAASSGCSQVRFLGVSASSTTGFTLAARYNVVSDKLIYATVPAPPAVDGTTAGSPAAGTGSMRVQVLNSTGTGTSGGLSTSSSSEVFYRGALTANITGTVSGNPVGGGVVNVPVSGVASLTSTTLPQEKITAYLYSTVVENSLASPQVAAAPVAFKDASSVNVTLPPGSPSGDFVGIMLVHDGIPGTADVNALKYPAVISKIETCPTSAAAWVSSPTSTLPDCTGSATLPTSGSATVKVSGKGMSGVGDDDTAWNFEGTGGDVTPACEVVSDTLAYCNLTITTAPTSGAAAVTFVPADPPGAAATPAFAPTAGSFLLYSTLV